ncbi:MAG: ABC transporter permease [Candidatus Acidiferrum sp.]
MKLLWLRSKRDKELEKEIQHHLHMAETERIERGASQNEAQSGARREFGNVGLVKEVTRDAWGWRWLENLYEDLRYGIRTLGKNKGFAGVAILTLALGIGANTAIFSLIDAALLRAIPVRDASELVLVQWHAHKDPNSHSMRSYGDCKDACSLSAPFYHQIESQSGLFASVAAFAAGDRLDLSGNGAASTVDGPEFVSGNYFDTLGVRPALGRLISAEDDTPSAPAVVVLSYNYWRSQFGGAASVVGKKILLNKVPCTIVGVAEPRFDSLSPGNALQLWMPLSAQPQLSQPWDNREVDQYNWWLVIVGRLQPGTVRTQAQAAISTIFHNDTTSGAKPMFKQEDDPAISLTPIEQGLTGIRTDISAPLYVLLLVVGIVLLIACANVAGLMLARAASRQKEMAVRFALGASRWRILQQLLTESLLISLAGGALGILFASWCVASIVAFMETNQNGPMPFTPGIDGRVLMFTALVSVLTGILFGVAPALRGLRVDLTPVLKEGAGTSSQAGRAERGWFNAGSGLVVAQVALSIVVLAGAGLLVRTLQNLKNLDPGFDTRNILTFNIDPTLIGYKTADSNNLYEQLLERLAKVPGVNSVTYSWTPLLGGGHWSTGFHLEGKPKDTEVDADELSVGPEFFHTMRIPLLAGHEFSAAEFAIAQRLDEAEDRRRAARAAKLKPGATAAGNTGVEDLPPTPAIVNQMFVRKYMAGISPIGHIFGTEEADPAKDVERSSGWEIVGIVGDAKYSKLRSDVAPTIYVPSSGGSVSFSLRTETDPAKFTPQIRSIVGQMDSNLPVFNVRTESQQIDQQILKERLIARMSGFFGTLALLLACIGLYGLVSYEVARRTREIGIRAALGAEKRDVLRMVLSQGMRLTLVGALVGIGLALALTRYAKDLLFGVKAADPLTYVAVTVLLGGVTLAACYVPARRAMRVDPVVALRHE